MRPLFHDRFRGEGNSLPPRIDCGNITLKACAETHSKGKDQPKKKKNKGVTFLLCERKNAGRLHDQGDEKAYGGPFFGYWGEKKKHKHEKAVKHSFNTETKEILRKERKPPKEKIVANSCEPRGKARPLK